jgi:hypothetical protein
MIVYMHVCVCVCEAVREAKSYLPSDIRLYCKGDYTTDGLQAIPLDSKLTQASDLPPSKDPNAKFSGKFVQEIS